MRCERAARRATEVEDGAFAWTERRLIRNVEREVADRAAFDLDVENRGLPDP